MSAKKYHLIHLVVLGMLFVIFFSSLITSQILLRNFRIDLTEKKLYTLTQDSQNILQALHAPIEIKLFLSQQLAQQYPSIRSFSQRVRRLLLEVESLSSGKVKIQYIDPEPFSEDEDSALSYGMRPLAVIDDAPLYFGLVAENRQGGVEAVPRFHIERQHQLEYDLIRILQSLNLKEKPALGIITSLPLDTGVGGLPAALQGQAKPFLIYQQLFAHFKLEFLEQNLAQIPRTIKTLLIAHPKKLNARTLYAIDQFVLRGGRVLLLVDPFCEISQLTNRQGKKLKGLGLTSSLEPLLAAWGVQYEKRDIVADRKLAQSVSLRDSLRNSQTERDYVLWLSARKNNIAQDEVVTKGLSAINFATSGHFQAKPKSSIKFKPLITSTADSMLFSTKYIQTPRTPDDLLAVFRASGKKHVLAAKLSGEFTSAFTARPKKRKSKRKARLTAPPAPHLAKSQKPTEIIIIADSDLLEKRLWVDLQSYYQQNIVVPTADNATFIINAIDTLMGNDILINLRARAPETRTFEAVDTLRRQASQQLAAEEYRLRQKIQTIERRRTTFGANSENTKGGQTQSLNLERELLTSRKALHRVRRALNQDIEALGFWVKFFNVLFVPLVLIVLVLIYPWIKKRFQAE